MEGGRLREVVAMREFTLLASDWSQIVSIAEQLNFNCIGRI